MEKIEKCELQTFPRNQRIINNLNNPKSVTEFLMDVGDSFIHPHNADCYIVLSGAFTSAITGGMKTEKVKLIDNFFLRLILME